MARTTVPYIRFGLSGYYLTNGIIRSKIKSGLFIKREDELIRTIAVTVCRNILDIEGGELKAIRNALNTTQQEMGMIINQQAQNLERWERGIAKINGSADQLIRLIALNELDNLDLTSGDCVSVLARLRAKLSNKRNFKFTFDGDFWKHSI